MKPNNQNRNNIILAIVAIVLVAGVVYYFFSRDVAPVDLLSSVPSSENPKIDGDLLSTLRQLKSISLDESIFTNVVFLKLSDLSKPLAPQGNPGRSNPFAPIGTDVLSSTGSSFSAPLTGTSSNPVR